MQTLNLYKDRRPYDIILDVRGKQKTFKIPTEITVEESERLLETEIKIKKLFGQEVDTKNKQEKIDEYFDTLLEYILVLLEHYQDITKEELKKMMSQAEIIRVFEFFKQQRFLHIMGLDSDDTDSKKKTNTAVKQLETLRQCITFLVMSGFGLLEVRKLYLDELLSFYSSIIYIKEKQGEIKEGTFDSLKARGGNDVSSLKKQLFNIQKNGR